jgi:hypothetical protein
VYNRGSGDGLLTVSYLVRRREGGEFANA